MHIAMNRFEVTNGLQKQFEQSIKEQFEQLKGTRGYLSFHLIRGGTNGAVTFYSSHTKWANKEDFFEMGWKSTTLQDAKSKCEHWTGEKQETGFKGMVNELPEKLQFYGKDMTKLKREGFTFT